MIKLDVKISREWNVQDWKSYWFKNFHCFNIQIVKDTTQWFRFHVAYRFGTFIFNFNVFSYEFDLYI